MPKQQSGGNKKRPRKPRYQHSILKQEERKGKWLKAVASDKTIQKPKRKVATTLTSWHENVIPKSIRPVTIEDQYRSYRKTKGRQGLNPNPKTRQEENIWVHGRYQQKKDDGNVIWSTKQHYLGGRFPITELMEKPIQYSKPTRK